MCSISGCIIFNHLDTEGTEDKMKEIIERATDRGRDSWGIISFDMIKHDRGADVIASEKKEIGAYAKTHDTAKLPLINEDTFLVMSNNRAEPTTEFVEKKTRKDVQPFYDSGGDIYVAHNGIIANDAAIREKWGIQTDTKIDTAVIPEMLAKSGWNGNSEELRHILQTEVVGSYSFVIYDRRHPNKVYFVNNFKPLWLNMDYEKDVLFFSSLKRYMKHTKDYDLGSVFETFEEVKPYTLLEIDRVTKKVKKLSMYPQKEGKKKALIVASGGMDSTVCAAWARAQGYEIMLLHYNYSCKATDKEIQAIQSIGDFYKCPVKIIDMTFLKQYMSGSTLFQSDSINNEGDGVAGAEFAHEYVYARNLIFMSLTTGFAESWGYDYVILGGNLEESGAYADNEYIFQKKFNDLIPNSIGVNSKIEILTPVANLMKHEIVRLGLQLKAPLHLTWSCYEHGDNPCQKCGPDYMRRLAFKMNGYIDMQDTVSPPAFWKGCKKVDIPHPDEVAQ